MKRTLAAAALLVLCACPSSQKISGEEIASFTFTAKSVSTDCSFSAIPPFDSDGGYSFTFDAILSHDPSTTQAYMRLGSVERDAGFDGQVFTSLHSAARLFTECGSNCSGTTIAETIQVAVLSRSQEQAAGGTCPPNPLDGGVAPPDGGVAGPRSLPGGFDAVRACGVLVDAVIPDGGPCTCSGCSMLFTLEAVPKGSSR